jgi:hypothetical protein
MRMDECTNTHRFNRLDKKGLKCGWTNVLTPDNCDNGTRLRLGRTAT